MRFASLVSAAALAATAYAQSPSLIYQFQNSFSGVGYVNIENIAVRPNGLLLLNTVTGAVMAQIDPANPVPEVVVNITGAADPATRTPGSLAGIAETGNDVYTIAAGNFAFGPTVPGGAQGITGTFSVWSVDLTGPVPKTTQIVAIPEAGGLNGVTAIPGGNKDLVLIADSVVSTVWAVNIKTGAYKSVISSTLFSATATNSFGINGVHVRESYLYWTNSAQNTFGAVPIDVQTGEPTGEIAVYATGVNGTFFDDFALKPHNGGAYIASHPSEIYQVTQAGAVNLVVNDTALLNPTSAAFAKDGCSLYITTGGVGGGPSGPMSGQVFSLDTCAAGSKKAKKWVA